MAELLRVDNVRASIEEKEILKGINLTINKGEIHVVMGTNGAGKSTLANVIMGNPAYEVTEGSIVFDGENITEEAVNDRAKKGIFMSFQHPISVPGITVENFIRTAKNTITGENVRALAFKKELKVKMEELSFDTSYANRYVNEGFSGGERKKNEILQMSILNPKLAILDETDSGLDVDAVRIVSAGIKDFLSEDNAVIIITHHRELLESIDADYVHVIKDGKIAHEGDASLMDEIEKRGYEWV